MTTLPTLYIPHGGGPCFFMQWNPAETWNEMGKFLSSLGEFVGKKPEAIIVVSAHWESQDFAVTTSSAPSLIYDYHGFPEHTYHLKYDAPGSPETAQKITDAFTALASYCEVIASAVLITAFSYPLSLFIQMLTFPLFNYPLKKDSPRKNIWRLAKPCKNCAHKAF